MSKSTELIAAVLQDFCGSDDDAIAVIAAAKAIGVDPLDYCAHRYKLGAAKVLQRAASWAGLAFSPTVPFTGAAPEPAQRLDDFATTRRDQGQAL